MRKRIIATDTPNQTFERELWIDLIQTALAELTSEDADHPLEAAFHADDQHGWRAADPGPQLIRLLFEQPLHLRRVRLVFDETGQARTQEFVLRWSGDGGQSYHEIVRQQYTFSPPATTRELEEYQVDLPQVTVLELHLIPDISGGLAHATLTTLQVA